MIFIPILVLFFCLVFIIWIFYAYFWNRGAVYYPTTIQAANQILDSLKMGKGEVLMDLGCGDGVMLIEAAKRGIKGIGYELNPILVYQTKRKIKELDLEKLIEIRLKNMYEADFNQADVLYFYQFPRYLNRFEKILEKRLKRKKLVVSNRYEFPKRKWNKKVGRVYCYWFGE